MLPIRQLKDICGLNVMIETGAEAIITACPFCVQMLEASIKGLEVEDKISVVTLSELLVSSLKKEEK